MTGPEEAAEHEGTPRRWVEAVDELEAIVGELERDDVDVDVLVERVARAGELVEWCRDRLDAARHQVDEIVVGLDPTAVDGDEPASEDG